jgi:hypothetical protein
MHVLFVRRGEERRIEDLFLDRRVYLQRIADFTAELFLAGNAARALELRKPAFHLPMIGFQQGNRVLAGTALAGRGLRTGTMSPFHLKPLFLASRPFRSRAV